MRVRALVAYDGTGYGGFQRQKNAPSVQEVLENALERLMGTRVQVLAAGRTDAGVHAEGQVIAFDVVWSHGLEELQCALNSWLPDDVAVREVQEAPADFHPRYDALSRRYRYTIYNAPTRCPFARLYSFHVPVPLDVEAMQEAAQHLVGEHDFAAFGQPPQGTNTVRRVLAAEWSEELPWLRFEIEANAFLYRMVRTIVGTLLKVGLGRMTVADFKTVLVSRDRRLAGPAVPPCGLSLVAVRY